MSKVYRYDDVDHMSLMLAVSAVRKDRGWSVETCDVVLSEPYAVGVQEGGRGSVYGVSCYETQEACDADETGAHAPRILVISGDEAWAMGRDDD
jgi:hypothetical protein